MAELIREQLRELDNRNREKRQNLYRRQDAVLKKTIEAIEEAGLLWNEALQIPELLEDRIRYLLGQQGYLFKRESPEMAPRR